MKKILFLVAAMCCTMLASVYATDLSDNAVIKVGATTVTDENKGDILGDGKVSYDPGTHTLSIADKGKVEGGLSIEAKGTYGVTISVSGYASITSNSHALQYVGYNPGYPLTITGNHEANLTVRTNASPSDAVAILCAKAPTSLKDDTYTLKVNGGMRLNVSNDWSGKYEAIICNHLDFDHVTVAITAPSGEDAVKCLDDEKNSFVKTASCMYDDNEVTFYKYDKAYPVIIDGFQLNDGKDELTSSDMKSIKDGKAVYDAEKRTLYLNMQFELEPAHFDGINIIDDGGSPVIIQVPSISWMKPVISASGTFMAIYAAGPAIIDLGGADMELSSTNQPALAFDKELTIRGGDGIHKLIATSTNSTAIYGGETTSKLIIDHCLVNVESTKEPCKDFELEEKGVKLWDDDFTWDATQKCIIYSGSPVKNTVVKWEISEFAFAVVAEPAEAGTITFDLGDNPYYHTATGNIVATVSVNTGWEFYHWQDLYDSSEPDYAANPRTFNMYSTNEKYTALFYHKVATTDTYYFMGSDYGIYAYDAKLNVPMGATKIADVPVTSSWTIDKMAYADGKIYWVEYNGDPKWAMMSAEFDGTTMGAASAVVAAQEKYQSWRGLAYNENDGLLYAICYDNESYKTMLIKIDPSTGTITPIDEVPTDAQYAYAMAFDGSGNLYVVADSPAKLYKMNPADASVSLVGEMGVLVMDYTSTSFVFDVTGEAYLSGGAPNCVYLVDSSTGKSYFVSESMTTTNAMFTVAPAGTKYEIEVKVKAGDEAKGSVSPAGKKNVVEGKTFAFSAKANKGYLFDQWVEDGNTEASRTITVSADATYTAAFKDDPDMKIYPIKIGGVELYSGATTIVYPAAEFPALTAGAVVYDAEKNTLTLSAANIDVTGALKALELGGADAKSKDLTIVIVGDCKISSVADALAISDFRSVTIKGEGLGAKLTINSDASGIKLDGVDLTIDGLETKIVATSNGIAGTEAEQLTVIGANLQVKGGAGSIVGLNDLVRNYCKMTGFEFNSDTHQVEKGGSKATDNVVFEPWKSVTVTPVEKGSGHFTLTSENTGDSFTDKGYFESGDKVTIVAEAESGYSFARWTDDPKWGDLNKKDDWWTEERPVYTMTGSDKAFEALFYYEAGTEAEWYGIHNNKMVKFSLGDKGEEVVSPKTVFGVSGVTAGDFADGEWYLADGANMRAWEEFSDFDKDTEFDTKTLAKKASIESGVTDMAYDIMGGEAYAVKGKKLYRLEDDKFKEIATFKYKEADAAITGIAIDGSSTMYALGSGDPGVLYTVAEIDEEKKEAKLEIVGDEKEGGKIGVAVTTAAQSISFDHVSGALLWGAPDYIRVISVDDAKAHIAGDLGCKKGTQGVIKAMHRADVTVTVQVKIAEGCEEMGTVALGSGTKTKGAYIQGTPAVLTATPNTGYKFVKWMVVSGKNEKDFKGNDQASCTVSAAGNTYVAYFEVGEGLDNIDVNTEVRKVMMDGTLYILRDGKIYNATGIRVK